MSEPRPGFWSDKSGTYRFAFAMALWGSLGALAAATIVLWGVGYPVEGVPNPFNRTDVIIVSLGYAAAGLAILATLAMLRWRMAAALGMVVAFGLGLYDTCHWVGGISLGGAVWAVGATPLLLAALSLVVDSIHLRGESGGGPGQGRTELDGNESADAADEGRVGHGTHT